jgi:hypothetical protein
VVAVQITLESPSGMAAVAALPGGARACPRVNTGRMPETGAMLDVCRT